MAVYTIGAGVTIGTVTVAEGESGSFVFSRMFPAFKIVNNTSGTIYFSRDGALTADNITSDNVIDVPTNTSVPIQYLQSSKILYFYAAAAGVVKVIASNSMQAFR